MTRPILSPIPPPQRRSSSHNGLTSKPLGRAPITGKQLGMTLIQDDLWKYILTVASSHRFNFFHSEPLQSAKDRYAKEINRVVGVLDSYLKNRSWLVGDKCTYADLAFFMWNAQIPYVLKDAAEPWNIDNYPNYKKWMEAMQARDSVKHVMSVLMDKEVKSEGKVQ